jgi:catechol 2,3-dioxygenase
MIPFRFPDNVHIRHVHLRVANVERVLGFYRDLLGFKETSRRDSTISLSTSSREPIVILTEDTAASPGSRRYPGLFHTAILYPSRAELARIFRRLLEHRYPFQGFSDHGVSEALYVADPEGNGVELYADRPRETWRTKDGSIEMSTKPLDTESLLAQADDKPWTTAHPDTRIGHIHLQVSDLTEAERFYHELLGFDVTQRSYPGALFVSAGGYHHHIGLNVWNSHGSSPAPANTLGLARFAVGVPDAQVIPGLEIRLRDAGLAVELSSDSGSLLVRDLDGIEVEVIP